jgi:hypothetical protein
MQLSQIIVFWHLAVAFRCHHIQDVDAADSYFEYLIDITHRYKETRNTTLFTD